jgi:hypothetical protein
MNLANTFARIRVLFPRRKAKDVRLIELNEHMKRDLGVYNASSDRRVHERPTRTEEFIVFSVATRAP